MDGGDVALIHDMHTYYWNIRRKYYESVALNYS